MQLSARIAFLVVCAALFLPFHAVAGPIQDNSFLLEEAYNQDPGVVQHISHRQIRQLRQFAA